MKKRTKPIAAITLSAAMLFVSLFAGYGSFSGVKSLWNTTVEALTDPIDGPGSPYYFENSDPAPFTCKCDNYSTYKTLYNLSCFIPWLGPLIAAFGMSCDWNGIDIFEVQYKCCTSGSGRCNAYDSGISPALCKQYQTGYWTIYN